MRQKKPTTVHVQLVVKDARGRIVKNEEYPLEEYISKVTPILTGEGWVSNHSFWKRLEMLFNQEALAELLCHYEQKMRRGVMQAVKHRTEALTCYDNFGNKRKGTARKKQ